MRGLREVLKSLPTKLDETYNDAIARIRGQVPELCELAMSALTWISHALRPLKVGELREALAIKPGDQELDPEAFPDIALVVSASAGLITVDAESQEVRLVHFTVEEYFKQRKLKLFPDADFLMAQTCITCLFFDVSKKYIFLDTKYIRSEDKLISFDDLRSFERYNPFKESSSSDEMNDLLDYAVENWGHHLRGEAENVLQDRVLDFLSDEQRLHYPRSMVHSRRSSTTPCALHLLVHFNLTHILSEYLNSDRTDHIKNGSFFTSLHLAVYKGHDEIAKLLLSQADMDVNGLDNTRQTPLAVAAIHGRINIFSMLLERHELSADSKDKYGRTPLLYAARNGHEGIVRALIDRDDVIADSKDEDGRTSLSCAARHDHEGIVRILIKRDDVTADSKDEDQRTPLLHAAINGHEDIVRMLINRDDVLA